jgi:hypothetical protein
MSSNKAAAAAPIATGSLLAGTAAREVAQQGLELWTALVLAGGLSAIAVGIGVLGGFSGFNGNDDTDGNRSRTTVALASLAVTCIAVGAGVALA